MSIAFNFGHKDLLKEKSEKYTGVYKILGDPEISGISQSC